MTDPGERNGERLSDCTLYISYDMSWYFQNFRLSILYAYKVITNYRERERERERNKGRSGYMLVLAAQCLSLTGLSWACATLLPETTPRCRYKANRMCLTSQQWQESQSQGKVETVVKSWP